MNLSEAIAAVRELEDLPQPRRIEYVKRLVNAPTTGAWSMIVAAAKSEALQARFARQTAVDAEYAARLAEVRRREAVVAPTEPQEARTASRRAQAAPWEPKPVIVSYTTPKNPNGQRREARPPMLYRNTAQREIHTCSDEHAHGETITCYASHRCRCESCRDAKRREQKRYAERKQDLKHEKAPDQDGSPVGS